MTFSINIFWFENINPFDKNITTQRLLESSYTVKKKTFPAFANIQNVVTSAEALLQINELEKDPLNFSNHEIKIFEAISLFCNTRIKLGDKKKNRGSKRTADGHEKKYINREILAMLRPTSISIGKKLDYDFDLLLFHIVGVEASTIRTYKTSIRNFNRFMLSHQRVLLMSSNMKTKYPIIKFCMIISSILSENKQFLQKMINRYVIWGASIYAKRSVLNLCSGVIFFGEFLTEGILYRFPRPTPKLIARAKKIAKNGTGGAIPFANQKLPLLFIEWLILQKNTKDQWSAVFYALMFYAMLRPTITYTLSPKCLTFWDKYENASPKPTKKTKKVILEVFRYKNQENHQTGKKIPFEWRTNQVGPSPTNIIQHFRHLFKKHGTSPKFTSSAKLMQNQLLRFKKAEKINFKMQKYTPESFRESMMGVAVEKLHPYQLMYVTHHRSERSIKHTYIVKQKTNTFNIYNEVINRFFN